MTDKFDLQGDLAARLADYISDKLSSYPEGYAGLRWSPNMTEDNTDALVVDAEGTEYVLDIDVTLWQPQPEKNWGYTRVQPPPRVVTEKTDDRL